MNANVGGEPAQGLGRRSTTPGPNAVARLNFKVDSLPVDDALLRAMPGDVRKVVDDFKPTGRVRGRGPRSSASRR